MIHKMLYHMLPELISIHYIRHHLALVKHEFNRYHGGVMYMPGSFMKRYEVYDDDGKKRVNVFNIKMNIIKSKQRFEPNSGFIFKAEVKLTCSKNKINDFINFPPIFRNVDIMNDEQTIGSYMYNYMKDSKLNSIDKGVRKLANLLDTCGQWMKFTNY